MTDHDSVEHIQKRLKTLKEEKDNLLAQLEKANGTKQLTSCLEYLKKTSEFRLAPLLGKVITRFWVASEDAMSGERECCFDNLRSFVAMEVGLVDGHVIKLRTSNRLEKASWVFVDAKGTTLLNVPLEKLKNKAETPLLLGEKGFDVIRSVLGDLLFYTSVLGFFDVLAALFVYEDEKKEDYDYCGGIFCLQYGARAFIIPQQYTGSKVLKLMWIPPKE